MTSEDEDILLESPLLETGAETNMRSCSIDAGTSKVAANQQVTYLSQTGRAQHNIIARNPKS